MDNNLEITLKVNYLRDIWKEFCETHTLLYEATCEEYIQLMASDMDELEKTIQVKSDIIQSIDKLDSHRQEIINEIALLLKIEPPTSISELLSFDGININIKIEVEKLNLVLLDIIGKITDQNKKNQFFLNKAILSLRELKDSFTGKANYNTYSSTGVTTNNKTY